MLSFNFSYSKHVYPRLAVRHGCHVIRWCVTSLAIRPLHQPPLRIAVDILESHHIHRVTCLQ